MFLGSPHFQAFSHLWKSFQLAFPSWVVTFQTSELITLFPLFAVSLQWFLTNTVVSILWLYQSLPFSPSPIWIPLRSCQSHGSLEFSEHSHALLSYLHTSVFAFSLAPQASFPSVLAIRNPCMPPLVPFWLPAFPGSPSHYMYFPVFSHRRHSALVCGTI